MTSLSKPVAKKRGRPVGSKNKAQKTKPAAASKSFKQAELQRLRKVGEIVGKNIELMKDNTELVSHINNLEHQIIGFRAVISYLEKQAGLRNTQ
jgi:hypothetical protein